MTHPTTCQAPNRRLSWAFSVFLFLLLASVGIHASPGGDDGVCPSGDLPSSLSGMPFCQVYSRRTCCAQRQARGVYETVLPYIFSEIRNPDCRDLAASLLCHPCFPPEAASEGGVCHSTCDAWFRACGAEWFSRPSPSTVTSLPPTALVPCNLQQSLVCSRLDDLVSSGTELCEAFGVSVAEENRGSILSDPEIAKFFKDSVVTVEQQLENPLDTCFQPEIITLPSASQVQPSDTRKSTTSTRSTSKSTRTEASGFDWDSLWSSLLPPGLRKIFRRWSRKIRRSGIGRTAAAVAFLFVAAKLLQSAFRKLKRSGGAGSRKRSSSS